MSFVRDRITGIAHYTRVTFFGILGIACALVALGCVAMAIWGLIQIFFVTMWLTIKAALFGIGAAVMFVLATGMFSLASRRPKVKARPTVEVLPPEQPRAPLRSVK